MTPVNKCNVRRMKNVVRSTAYIVPRTEHRAGGIIATHSQPRCEYCVVRTPVGTTYSPNNQTPRAVKRTYLGRLGTRHRVLGLWNRSRNDSIWRKYFVRCRLLWWRQDDSAAYEVPWISNFVEPSSACLQGRTLKTSTNCGVPISLKLLRTLMPQALGGNAEGE